MLPPIWGRSSRLCSPHSVWAVIYLRRGYTTLSFQRLLANKFQQEVISTLKMMREKVNEKMQMDGFLEHDEDFYAVQVTTTWQLYSDVILG